MFPNAYMGVVTEISIAADGAYAEVLLDTGDTKTAHVGMPYAGEHFGAWCPLHSGDLVVIAAQDANEMVIVARLSSETHPPPNRAQQHPDDFVVDVKPGDNLYLRVREGANVYVVSEGGGKVKLGAEDALEPAVLGTSLKARIEGLETWAKTHTHPYVNVMAPATTAPTTQQPPATPDFAAQIVEVK